MSDKENMSKDSILETLELATSSQNNQEIPKTQNLILPCLFCEFNIDKDKQDESEILQHLYREHRIIISDVNDIKNLRTYLEFWKKEFEGLLLLLNS